MPDTHTNARAVVLLSGGLDSAVALAEARHAGNACTALSFDYGQRHRLELDAARAVAHHLGAADHRVIRVDLRAIGGSALTDAIDVPKDRPQPASPNNSAPSDTRLEIPVTYVPARNLVFLSLAAALAEVIGARELYIGVNAVDYSGYPDCRRPFIDAFERAATLGTRAGAQQGVCVHVVTPLVALSKSQIIRRGVELGVDFSLTSSCYDPDLSGRACGRCDSCAIRRRGFADAGIPDPTRYQPGAAP